MFTLILQSDPEGAELHQKQGRLSRLLGSSPAKLQLPFDRRPNPGLLGQLGIKSWYPRLPDDVVWDLQEVESDYVLRLKNLELRRSGFEPELFEVEWRIPKDLNRRDPFGAVISEFPRERTDTVVMRNPTGPEFARVMVLDSNPSGAMLFPAGATDREGQVGLRLPKEFAMGFGRVRDASGKILKWKWWIRDPHPALKFFGDGRVVLSGKLIKEGYDPEEIRELLLFRPDNAQSVRQSATIQLTSPAEAQEQFRLRVDSLPTDASVFLLRDDGSLGGRLGQTPFVANIGIAELTSRKVDGSIQHKDWLIWAPEGLISWEKRPDGRTEFFMTCALYREGFATEKVLQKIFELTPGRPIPKGFELTIPLLHPEQAAARETRAAIRVAPTVQDASPPPQPFVWQPPPSVTTDDVDAMLKDKDAEREKEKPLWRRVFR